MLGLPGAHGVYGVGQFLLKDLAIEEEEGGEGLVLGRGGNVLVYGQVGEERCDPSTSSGHASAPPKSRG